MTNSCRLRNRNTLYASNCCYLSRKYLLSGQHSDTKSDLLLSPRLASTETPCHHGMRAAFLRIAPRIRDDTTRRNEPPNVLTTFEKLT